MKHCTTDQNINIKNQFKSPTINKKENLQKLNFVMILVFVCDCNETVTAFNFEIMAIIKSGTAHPIRYKTYYDYRILIMILTAILLKI